MCEKKCVGVFVFLAASKCVWVSVCVCNTHKLRQKQRLLCKRVSEQVRERERKRDKNL